MTIFNSAYDTTAGKGFVTHKILQALKEAVIRDNVEQSNSFDLPQTEGVRTFFIVNKRVSESNVPYFTHPFIFGMSDVRKEDNVKYIATDIRPYASYNKNHVEDSDALSIRNKMELIWQQSERLLTLFGLMSVQNCSEIFLLFQWLFSVAGFQNL